MKLKLLFGCILMLCCFMSSFAQTKIKKMEEDENYGRTNVVKEEGINDYQILDEQFADADVGKIVRIGIEKPPKDKPVKEKIEKPKPPKPEPKPEVKKDKPVAKPAPKVKDNTTVRTTSSVGARKSRTKRIGFFKLKKRRKVSKRKKYSCYQF